MSPVPHRPDRPSRAPGATGLCLCLSLCLLLALAASPGCGGADAPAEPAPAASTGPGNPALKSADDMSRMRLDGEEPGTKKPRRR